MGPVTTVLRTSGTGLYGGEGNDTLYGEGGNDYLDGEADDDTLIGVNPVSATPGTGEIDQLSGGAGHDRFVLGTSAWQGYDDHNAAASGTNDYARIVDFNSVDDLIQIQGPKTSYRLEISGANTNLYLDKPGVEPDELIVIIQGATGLDINSNAFVFVEPTTQLAIADLAAVKPEGDSGSTAFTFTVTRSGNLSGASTVAYAVTGSGANAADAADFGGTFPAGTVNFAVGETSQTVSVNVSGDTVVESNEGFTVTLSNPGNATLGTASASGTIQNDDVPPPPALAISALAAVKPEGDSGSTAFTFTVTRSGELSAASTVAYAVTGSGANAADFGGTLPAGTVNFAAGETSKTVTVNVAGDTTVEADEGFTVTLSNPGNGTIVKAAATGTILNDDYDIMFGNVFLSTSGNDTFTGTLGIDTVSYEKAPASVTVDLAVTTAQTTRHGIDTLVNIDNLIGSDFNDRLRGNGGDNILEGGAGTDTLTGGNGSDLYYIDNAGDVVTETNAAAAGGTDTVYTKVNHTLSANVENLRILTAGAVNGTGNTLNNILYAGAGNNVLNGDAGIDTASYAYATAGVTASLATCWRAGHGRLGQ